MTVLEEIDHKLSLLPKYLRYRADTIISSHEYWSEFGDARFVYSKPHLSVIKPFDQWLGMWVTTGEDERFVYMRRNDGFTMISRKIKWD